MLVKRALVVDDSKSARAFLARMLQDNQVEVDSAETAEQAIEYLTKHCPDVIFMDHLMPGMDGFQAVQAIKGNPRTAAIPILMYTSQEGELYLGQARALGAVGVLPKSMSPADVRMVLQQLQLDEPAPADPVILNTDAFEVPTKVPPTLEVSVPPASPRMEELLKDEVAALRRHVAEALNAQGQQVVREVRGLVQEAAAATPVQPPMHPETPRHSPFAWVVALAASVVAAVVGTLWWQGEQQRETLRSELMDSRSTVALLTARLAPAPQSVDMLAMKVPYGEAPLAGGRIAALREFVAHVAAAAQKGTIEVRRYSGRFCLSGNAEAGYALADGAASSGSCSLVAEATDAALGGKDPESAAFEAALAELRKQYADLLTIDVAAPANEAPRHAYPETSGTPPRAPTAGEWNAAAADNNRVEIRWHPAT